MSDRTVNAIKQIDGYSACSGIKDDKDGNDYKARQNHYGFTVTAMSSRGPVAVQVPPRPYITEDIEGVSRNDVDALREAVKIAIKNPSERKAEIKTTYRGDKYTTSAYDESGQSLGYVKTFGWTTSVIKVMREIAMEMHTKQMSNMELVAPNASSTIEKKKYTTGSDEPLVEYGNMKKATRSFVLLPNGEEA